MTSARTILVSFAVLTAACLTPKGYRTGMETMTATPDGSIDKESRYAARVRAIAAEKFGCDKKSVHVQQIKEDLFQVAGCDQNATLRCYKAKHFDCSEIPDEAPSPAAKKPDAKERPFDSESARRVLGSIAYDDCGTGGAGRVQVTFEPTGEASMIEVAEGEYDKAVASCLMTRFKAVKVPPFEGEAHVVSWRIKLP